MDPRLGRLKPKDWGHTRKYSLSATSVSLPAPSGDRYWPAPIIYDQGVSPMCVGAATACLLSSMAEGKYSESLKFNDQDIYAWAQAHDDEAGTPHDGTTVRAAMECVTTVLGTQLAVNPPPDGIDKMSQFLWATTAADALSYLFEYSGVVIGVNWYDSMMQPDEHFVLQIPPTATMAGGHSVFVRGGDCNNEWVVIRNSWGQHWGHNGDAFLSFANFERLLGEEGEAAVVVNTPLSVTEINPDANKIVTVTSGNVVNPNATA
jgi:hypothetical protein